MELMNFAAKSLERIRGQYRVDIAALSDAQLLGENQKAGRRPVDFVYEVALVNTRIANRLESIAVAPMSEDWTTAPDEMLSREAIVKCLDDSFEQLVSAIRAIPESEADKPIPTPSGDTPAFQLVIFAAMHCTYHDGQLNLIQALGGDMEWHWENL